MDNPNNRRMIVGVVVAIAVMFGVLSLATMSSYNQGLVDGMARGSQIVVPNAAPAAPYVMQQPYYGRSSGPGFFGILFNVLLIGAVLFVISRIARRAFGWRHGGPGGPWMHGKGNWQHWRNGPFNNNDPRNAPNDFRNTPNKQDEQVI